MPVDFVPVMRGVVVLLILVACGLIVLAIQGGRDGRD